MKNSSKYKNFINASNNVNPDDPSTLDELDIAIRTMEETYPLPEEIINADVNKKYYEFQNRYMKKKKSVFRNSLLAACIIIFVLSSTTLVFAKVYNYDIIQSGKDFIMIKFGLNTAESSLINTPGISNEIDGYENIQAEIANMSSKPVLPTILPDKLSLETVDTTVDDYCDSITVSYKYEDAYLTMIFENYKNTEFTPDQKFPIDDPNITIYNSNGIDTYFINYNPEYSILFTHYNWVYSIITNVTVEELNKTIDSITIQLN